VSAGGGGGGGGTELTLVYEDRTDRGTLPAPTVETGPDGAQILRIVVTEIVSEEVSRGGLKSQFSEMGVKRTPGLR